MLQYLHGNNTKTYKLIKKVSYTMILLQTMLMIVQTILYGMIIVYSTTTYGASQGAVMPSQQGDTLPRVVGVYVYLPLLDGATEVRPVDLVVLHANASVENFQDRIEEIFTSRSYPDVSIAELLVMIPDRESDVLQHVRLREITDEDIKALFKYPGHLNLCLSSKGICSALLAGLSAFYKSRTR